MSPRGSLAALRFARGWMAPSGPGAPAGLAEAVVSSALPGVAGEVRALRVAPRGAEPHPGWVVLHGVTVLGLEHPSLLRFARALAASGSHVLVPEIPAWTRLELAPAEAQRLVCAAVKALAADPRTTPGGVGVAGFSFGGPQALAAAADADVAPHLRKVLAWGSYARFRSALAFSFSGELAPEASWAPGASEAEGKPTRPDPYARWVAGANLLPLVSGYGSLDATAAALRELSRLWGESAIDAYSPDSDPVRNELRAGLSARERGIFDIFAPPAGRLPDPAAAAEICDALDRAAALHHPLLDPVPALERIHVPVHLLHGREDVLIPWTETPRLEALIRPRAPAVHATITGLFSHSAGDTGLSRGAQLVEGGRLFQAVRKVLAFR
ncbi:hypothetical protein BH23GEM11_BH23GEM11_13770 [soil metagenome]